MSVDSVDLKQITAGIPGVLRDELWDYCSKNGTTMKWVVRTALEHFFDEEKQLE